MRAIAIAMRGSTLALTANFLILGPVAQARKGKEMARKGKAMAGKQWQ